MKIDSSSYVAVQRHTPSAQTPTKPGEPQHTRPVQVQPSRYDLTNISQNEILRLGRELVDQGRLSELDAAVLTIQLPRATWNADGSLKEMLPPLDDGSRRDLLAEYRSRIEWDDRHGGDSSVLRRILAVLEGVQAGRRSVDVRV